MFNPIWFGALYTRVPWMNVNVRALLAGMFYVYPATSLTLDNKINFPSVWTCFSFILFLREFRAHPHLNNPFEIPAAHSFHLGIGHAQPTPAAHILWNGVNKISNLIWFAAASVRGWSTKNIYVRWFVCFFLSLILAHNLSRPWHTILQECFLPRTYPRMLYTPI